MHWRTVLLLLLRKAHKQCVDVLFDCALLQKCSELMSRFYQALILHICAHDDSAGIQVVVKRL